MRQYPSPALTAIYFLLPVLEAQTIQVKPEVWGFVGQQEVILPCNFYPGSSGGQVTQVRWNLKVKNSTEKDITLVVHAVSSGDMNIPLPQYVDKLALKEYSLVIKNVDLDDAGVYGCDLATFPSGTFSDTTRLFISGAPQNGLSTGTIARIAVTLLVIVAGAAAGGFYLYKHKKGKGKKQNPTSVELDRVYENTSNTRNIRSDEENTDVYENA